MTHEDAQKILDDIIAQIFGYKNPWDLQAYMEKHAFDVRLPLRVNDFVTGNETWVTSINPTRFRNFSDMIKEDKDLMQPKKDIKNIEDVLKAWEDTNWFASERQLKSLNILESDDIRGSENIFRSQDIMNSKNVLFSDGAHNTNNSASVQRANTVSYSARVEDSNNISNSFSVNWSTNVNNSLFIQDCADLYECMFCSHINSKEYCIANMQFEKEEYFKIKKMVLEWVLSN